MAHRRNCDPNRWTVPPLSALVSSDRCCHSRSRRYLPSSLLLARTRSSSAQSVSAQSPQELILSALFRVPSCDKWVANALPNQTILDRSKCRDANGHRRLLHRHSSGQKLRPGHKARQSKCPPITSLRKRSSFSAFQKRNTTDADPPWVSKTACLRIVQAHRLSLLATWIVKFLSAVINRAAKKTRNEYCAIRKRRHKPDA
jgi:hypothetical protein